VKALDLFCGAGGVSRGLANAGFEITGVDIAPQPNYPFKLFKADVMNFLFDPTQYDFIWASPPCQAFTAYKRRKNHVKPIENLIPQVRKLLKQIGKPYVIENVGGAPLINPIKLCGSMFGLDVQRHRYFESNFPIRQPKCDHSIWKPRFAPSTNRKNLRKTVEVGVWRIPLNVQQKAMGIDWMNLRELSQAIPPSYSEYIAKEFLNSTPSGQGTSDSRGEDT
jgi:DNA (cytosine-5)-methyltransferase 1